MAILPLTPLDPATASEPARTALASVQKQYGFTPNLYRVFANAPVSIDAYQALSAAFARGTLDATERNVVALAVSRENGCHYCVAVHSTVADMQKDRSSITDAIRDGRPVDDRKLEALRQLAQALVRGRGRADAEVRAFLEAGYRAEQVLEVLVGIAMKTLSNYTNHLVETPLDDVFAKRKWDGR